MSEHTPTPWHTGSTEHTELIMAFRDDCECVIAELDTDDVEMDESAGNAAFVIKAVNNHQPLVDALLRAREVVNAIVLSTHSVSFDADLRAIDLALEGVGNLVSAPSGSGK